MSKLRRKGRTRRLRIRWGEWFREEMDEVGRRMLLLRGTTWMRSSKERGEKELPVG